MTQIKTEAPGAGNFPEGDGSGGAKVHYHYLTIEQRETLEKLIRSRIGGGSQLADYGVCIECGKDIGFVRLQADPSALHCQACARLPVSPKP